MSRARAAALATIAGTIGGPTFKNLKKGLRVARSLNSIYKSFYPTQQRRFKTQKVREYIMPRMGYRKRRYGRRRSRYSNRRRYSKRRRMAKSYRFSRKNVGVPTGIALAKRQKTFEVDQDRNSRTLSWDTVIDVEKGEDINQRERNMIKVHGIKLTYYFSNKFAKPLILHYGFISPKSSTQVSVTDWFRSSGNTRSADFAAGLKSLDYQSLGINTDLYTVLVHKKKYLAPGITPTVNWYSTGNALSWTFGKMYLKINRIIRFNSDTDTVPQAGNIFFFQYCCGAGELTGTPTAAIYTQVRADCFFSDVGYC